ncbi:MAG TPA: hypothetical protein VJQ45_02715 [Ktedonobacterales bacterium]|nr:hypothetical protein [Ktedonobacterales bacterium]
MWRSRTLGTLVLLICATAYGVAMVAFAAAGTSGAPGATPSDQLSTLVQLAGFFAYPVVGSLIVSRRPSNTVGWIFCAIGLGTATTAFSAGYIQHALAAHEDTQLATGLIDALGNGVWNLNLGLGSLLLFLFPDGKPISHRWRFIVWLDAIAIALMVIAAWVQPGPLEANGRVVNPIGLAAAGPVLNAVNVVGHVIFLPLVLLAVASVIVRYRRASGIQRQQIKWFALGAAAMVLLIVVTVSAVPDENSPLSTIGFALAFAMLPIGAGIGVLRYRLYDIDILINRTLVYGSLTLLLAAVYFGSVIGMQRMVRLAADSRAEQNPLIIVVSTLLIAALFTPLRRSIQRTIDRRFYRAKYDTARTLERFAATLRQQVELAQLEDHLVGVVEETMQPAHVSLWLRPLQKKEAIG